MQIEGINRQLNRITNLHLCKKRKLLFKDLCDWEFQLRYIRMSVMAVKWLGSTVIKKAVKSAKQSIRQWKMKMKMGMLTVLINELRSVGVLTDFVHVVNACISCLFVTLNST